MPSMLQIIVRRSTTGTGSITTMNRTRVKIGSTAVLKLPIPVSQVLADEDGAKDLIRLIEDETDFSQVNATVFMRPDLMVT